MSQSSSEGAFLSPVTSYHRLAEMLESSLLIKRHFQKDKYSTIPLTGGIQKSQSHRKKIECGLLGLAGRGSGAVIV